jgi:hypothetical protein
VQTTVATNSTLKSASLVNKLFDYSELQIVKGSILRIWDLPKEVSQIVDSITDFTQIKQVEINHIELTGNEIRVGNAETLTESTFAIQGVILAKALPPITANQGYKRAEYLAQWIDIGGMGTTVNKAAAANIRQLATRFAEQQGGSCDLPIRLDPFFKGDIIRVENRYFVGKHASKRFTEVAFKKDVDPDGTLSSYLSWKLRHTTDNSVKYQKYEQGEQP